MKNTCQCCGELKYSMMYLERTTGKVCAECRIYLKIAETALAVAGISGAIIDKLKMKP